MRVAEAAEQIPQILQMEVLEVLGVEEQEVKEQQRQQMELQILEVVVEEVPILVDLRPIRHSVEREVQVLLLSHILPHSTKSQILGQD
jgi:hypothetical protein